MSDRLAELLKLARNESGDIKALKESVTRWAETVPKDVAEDLFGDAK